MDVIELLRRLIERPHPKLERDEKPETSGGESSGQDTEPDEPDEPDDATGALSAADDDPNERSKERPRPPDWDNPADVARFFERRLDMPEDKR